MASNFKIIRHHNSDNLHLSLVGNFDGGSAMELISAIEDNATWFNRIFIHTCGLSSVTSFGKSVFLKNIRILRLRPRQLKITGDYAERMHAEKGNTIKSYQRSMTQAYVH